MIKISKMYIVYESNSYYPIFPNTLNLKEKVEKYLKEHPMPRDRAYLPEDLIADMESDGMYTLPEEIRPATIKFIENMLNEIIK